MADLIDRDALLKDMGLTDAVKYGNKDAEQQHRSYSTLMSYEIADSIWDAPSVNRWIPRSERLPEVDADVIAVIDGCSREAIYSDSSFIGSNFYRRAEEVTYWMPKPEPPEQV